jgi:putative ABC transport system permease protein
VVSRLAARDLRRRPAEAALLLIAITAAAASLTLGLVLHGVTDRPYQSTREATAGPDVVASAAPPPDGGQADLAGLKALAGASGVVGSSGPYPYTQTVAKARGVSATVWAQGRGAARAPVDRPRLTEGSWVRAGGVVLEASFADALGIGAGDSIVLGGRSFRVVGVAVTAAATPYPKVCFAPCWFGAAANAAERNAAKRSASGPVRSQAGPPPFAPRLGSAGLVWLTEADVRSLVSQPQSLGYVVNLKLADPAGAPAFVDAHLRENVDAPRLVTWQDILAGHDKVFENKQDALLVGSWLLGLLALATIAVLVGGRMADQTRRVGLLKAVGGTPALVAAVLLASTSSSPSSRRRPGWRSDGRRPRCSPIPVPGWSAARARCRSPCPPSAWWSRSRSGSRSLRPSFPPSAPPAPAPSSRWPTRPAHPAAARG